MVSMFTKLENLRKRQKKGLAVLLDPDKLSNDLYRKQILSVLNKNPPSLVLLGGSLVSTVNTGIYCRELKQAISCPVMLFPGHALQLTPEADGILLLSLVSGRNPEYLIGQHVQAAPLIRKSGLEVIPTAYMLIDGGTETSVSYISNTKPIPNKKTDITVATALASEQLGMKVVYLEAGSGAKQHVPPAMIQAVRETVHLPLIVGGGIRNTESLRQIFEAGADLAVIGTHFEDNPEVYEEFIRICE